MERHDKNAFTFVRHLLAGAVIACHCTIGRFPTRPELGIAAVEMFFVISGFMLLGSLRSNPSIPRYFAHRFFRIFPGFWVCLAFTALVLFPIALAIAGAARGHSLAEATFLPSALTYLANNLFIYISQTKLVATISSDASWSFEMANGSLWSLFPELICYMLLVCVVGPGIYHRNILRHLFYTVLGVSALAGLGMFLQPELLKEGGQVDGPFALLTNDRALFCVGAFALGSMLARHPRVCRPLGGGVAAITGALLIVLNGWTCLSSLVIGYAIISLSQSWRFGWPSSLGDYSYGMYLYSFPVQVILWEAGFAALGYLPYLLISIAVSVVAGVISWRFVEEPALAFGRLWIKSWGKRTDHNLGRRWYKTMSVSESRDEGPMGQG